MERIAAGSIMTVRERYPEVLCPGREAGLPAAVLDALRAPPVYRINMLELVYSSHPSNLRHRGPRASDRELLLAVRDGDEAALNELIGRKTKPLIQLVPAHPRRSRGGPRRRAGDLLQGLGEPAEVRRPVEPQHLDLPHREQPGDRPPAVAQEPRAQPRAGAPAPAPGGRRRARSATCRACSTARSAPIFRELSAGLSEKQRMVFLLREIEGLSSPEVAEILGCRESTVRNHLFNARKYLRRGAAAALPRVRRRLRARCGR